MKYLFIGGVADGEVIEVRDQCDTHEVQRRLEQSLEQAKMPRYVCLVDYMQDRMRSHYRKRYLQGFTYRIAVFGEISMSDDRILDQLIRGYKKP